MKYLCLLLLILAACGSQDVQTPKEPQVIVLSRGHNPDDPIYIRTIEVEKGYVFVERADLRFTIRYKEGKPYFTIFEVYGYIRNTKSKTVRILGLDAEVEVDGKRIKGYDHKIMFDPTLGPRESSGFYLQFSSKEIPQRSVIYDVEVEWEA